MTTGGKAGDLFFFAGRGGAPDGLHGDIVFLVPGADRNGPDLEVLRIKGDGCFLVNGKQVASEIEVYDAFRSFLVACEVNR